MPNLLGQAWNTLSHGDLFKPVIPCFNQIALGIQRQQISALNEPNKYDSKIHLDSNYQMQFQPKIDEAVQIYEKTWEDIF